MLKAKCMMIMRMKLDINKRIKWINLIKQNRLEEPYSQQYYNSSRFPIIRKLQRNMIL